MQPSAEWGLSVVLFAPLLDHDSCPFQTTEILAVEEFVSEFTCVGRVITKLFGGDRTRRAAAEFDLCYVVLELVWR